MSDSINGKVKVRIRIAGEEIVVSVPDNGSVIEILHERPETNDAGYTRTKRYRLCLQAGGIQLR